MSCFKHKSYWFWWILCILPLAVCAIRHIKSKVMKMYNCFKSLVISALKLIHAVIIFTVLSLWTNFHSFGMGISTCPNIICWKKYCSPLRCLDTLVRNQLIIYMWVYLWTFKSILPYAYVTYMSILTILLFLITGFLY